MKRIAIGLLLVIATLVAPTSHATPSNDGNEFLARCGPAYVVGDGGRPTTSKDILEVGWCMGIVEGLVSAEAMRESVKKATFCTGGGIQNGQAIRIALAYMRKNPDLLELPAGWLITGAMKEAFPC